MNRNEWDDDLFIDQDEQQITQRLQKNQIEERLDLEEPKETREERLSKRKKR